MEKEWACNGSAHQTHDLFMREVPYNSVPDFGMKLVWLHTMCLNETYSKVHIGKYLSALFHI
jgi:hypothetical protein